MKVSFSGSDDDFLNSNSIQISENSITTIEELIAHVHKTEPRARKSFFKPDGSLSNGTICLVDEQDIEISKDLQKDSHVVFISTLHGG